MAKITLDIPDELIQAFNDRIGGNPVELECFLIGLMDRELGSSSEPISEDELRLLDEGLESPLIEVNDAYWADLKARIAKKTAEQEARRSA